MKNFKKNFSLACIIVLGLSLLTVSSLASASLTSYNNVQINIQTTSNMPAGYYTVTAFNMTGYQESSVQTYYPAASFELPNGQFIFTVTAENQTNLIYPVPLASGAASSSGSGSTSTGTVSPPSLPVYVAPAVEYGYSVQQVSSSLTITITTQNVSSFPTNTLTIQVLYANGTAAAGASVSASTIGSSYYWGYEPNVVTWTTTDSNGYATLVTPTAPEQINAWSWLPVNTVVSVPPATVGGEPVNATGPMLPAYLGLAGSTLIIPPQTTATITMTTQQQNYWVTPYAATATPETGSATSASSPSSSAGPGAIPASVYAQQQGNPALQATQTPTPTPTTTAASSAATNGNTLPLTIVLAIVIAAVAATSLIIATRTKRKNNNKPGTR